jgi:hypothetical protein
MDAADVAIASGATPGIYASDDASEPLAEQLRIP